MVEDYPSPECTSFLYMIYKQSNNLAYDLDEIQSLQEQLDRSKTELETWKARAVVSESKLTEAMEQSEKFKADLTESQIKLAEAMLKDTCEYVPRLLAHDI
jgi:hypothetical protein